jgi:hypothetical protein
MKSHDSRHVPLLLRVLRRQTIWWDFTRHGNACDALYTPGPAAARSLGFRGLRRFVRHQILISHQLMGWSFLIGLVLMIVICGVFAWNFFEWLGSSGSSEGEIGPLGLSQGQVLRCPRSPHTGASSV